MVTFQRTVSGESKFNNEDLHRFQQQGLQVLQSLQNSLGIMASGQDDHFHAIFGRDSLWSMLIALEAGRVLARTESHSSTQLSSAAYDAWLQDLSSTVLRGLASLQGRVVNDFNEEQPGRIVHEHWNPVPQRMIDGHWPLVNGSYYGSFDATFLYITTAAQVDAYFHDQALLEELWPNIEAALRWMLDWSDLDHDGLIEYERRNPDGYGLSNQVWKDSSVSVVPRGDQPLQHPLAWIELQGYAWDAYTNYLKLAEQRRSLDPQVRQEIEQRMEKIRLGLQRFWLADEQFPAIVLDAQKQPVQAVSSNPGHLLWGDFLNPEQVQQIGERLMQEDMCTPWGVRTLSDQAYYYDALSYHCGTIWPFDNAITAIGLARHGLHAEARSIAHNVLQALQAMNNPVELYGVMPSSHIRLPKIEQEWTLVEYTQSTNIQAWTAAGMIYMASLLLSDQPE